MSPFPALEALSRLAPGSAQETGVVERLRLALAALGSEPRAAALSALTPVLTQGNTGLRLVKRLASAADAATRQLALELAARLPLPLDADLIAALRPLLLDRGVAVEAHLAAAAVVLRSVAHDATVAGEVLHAVVAGLGKSKMFERLDRLEAVSGRLAVLDDYRVRLEENQPMRCPRCPERLPRPEMIRHLWSLHGLLLDGRRVREPWEFIEEMVRDSGTRGDPRLLGRCFELAAHVDAENGEARVRQLLRPSSVELSTEQAECGDSLCPRCQAVLAGRIGARVRPVNRSVGRLATLGYTVEVTEADRVPWLEIEMPTTVVYRGPESRFAWTPRALTLLLAGPPVLVALGVAIAAQLTGLPGMLPVLLLLWLAFLAYLAVTVRGVLVGKPADRATDHAWTRLIPRLHAEGFAADDGDFAARLALASIGHGQPLARERPLAALLTATEKALAEGQATPRQLAPLYRLAIEDAAASGADAVLAVARQVSRCLEGALPLAFAEHLLAHWQSAWWSAGNLARLRALICERAFAAGFEVADLVESGRIAPALGDVLAIDDAIALARLRWLWSFGTARPWSRIDAAQTVFELANHPVVGARQLEQCHALLLSPSLPAVETGRLFGSAIGLCADGVRFGGVLFAEMPASFGVRARQAGGYELTVGPQAFSFRNDPGPLARQLESWCHFFFDEFVPQVPSPGRTSSIADRLREREALACPVCLLNVLPCPGETGIAVSR